MNLRSNKTGRFVNSGIFDYIGGDIDSQGIYQITNKVNGKIYIGSCFNNSFKRRWGKHLERLRKNKHNNKHLQSAYNLYGEDSFIFTICEYSLGDKEEVHKLEQKYLDSQIEWGHDYNQKKLASGGGTAIFSKKDCEDIINYYLEEAKSSRCILEKFGSCRITIRRVLNGNYVNAKHIPNSIIEKCKKKLKNSITKASSKNNIKSRKLTPTEALRIRQLHSVGCRSKELSRLFNVNESTIRDIYKNRTYK